jgi:regulatory protein YycI of two-component signal transduction system YycFG
MCQLMVRTVPRAIPNIRYKEACNIGIVQKFSETRRQHYFPVWKVNINHPNAQFHVVGPISANTSEKMQMAA